VTQTLRSFATLRYWDNSWHCNRYCDHSWQIMRSFVTQILR
jgi:hypothetical protein